jgi:hypothetical protein
LKLDDLKLHFHDWKHAITNGNFFEKTPMIKMDELSPYLDGGGNIGVMQALSRGNRNEKLHYFTS